MTALTIMGPENRKKATLSVVEDGVEVRFWRYLGGEERQINVALLDPCEVRGAWAQTQREIIDEPLHRVCNHVHQELWS